MGDEGTMSLLRFSVGGEKRREKCNQVCDREKKGFCMDVGGGGETSPEEYRKERGV